MIGIKLKRGISFIALLMLIVSGCSESNQEIPTSTIPPKNTATNKPSSTFTSTTQPTETPWPTSTLDPNWAATPFKNLYAGCNHSKSGDTWGIYTVGLNSEDLVRITDKGVNYHSPQFSPDGKYLSYVSYCEEPNHVVVFDRKTKNETRIADSYGIFDVPMWSPDANYLAFTVFFEGNSILSVYDVQERQVREILSLEGQIRWLTWPPNGQNLAFSWGNNEGFEIFRIDIEGKDLTRLTWSGGVALAPSWSPTGEWIAYIESSPNSYYLSGDLFLIDPDLLEKELNLDLTFSWIPPVWSPDGRFLAKETGSEISEIYIEGYEEKVIFGSIAMNIPRGYSPDGSKLLVDFYACGTEEIMYLFLRVVREGKIHQPGSAHHLLTYSGFSGWGQEAAWAPDGILIAFAGLRNPKRP